MGPDGPWATRAQAAASYRWFTRAAHRGVAGPPGEHLTFTTEQLLTETLADTLETTGVELGGYDRHVLARAARLLGPLDAAVLDSLFKRAAGDNYDTTVYAAVPPHLRLVEDAGSGARGHRRRGRGSH